MPSHAAANRQAIRQHPWTILHSSQDDAGAINTENYYSAYKLVAFYLAYLDGKLPITANP
jgi:hypothetical protein